MNRYATILCVVSLLLAAAGPAWANAVPNYTCTELIGYVNGAGATGPNSFAGSLLSNGTVVGETTSQAGIGLPTYDLCSWNSSGTMTVYASGSNPIIFNAWGGDAGQMVINGQGTVWTYSSSTGYAKTGNSNLSNTAPYGMSNGGLLFGANEASTLCWAYDLNKSTYYTFAPNASGLSWDNGANAGYVAGYNGGAGFLWNESNQSYTTISGLEAADGVSPNGQYLVGETTGGIAALDTIGGSSLGTYWSGQAAFVNDSGLVAGDTSSYGAGGYLNGRAMAYFPDFNGGTTVDLTTAYAPAGVTFQYIAGVNDAGQILVVSGLSAGYAQSYLLTPVPTPEPSTLLLAGTGLLGLLAYAWRKRK